MQTATKDPTTFVRKIYEPLGVVILFFFFQFKTQMFAGIQNSGRIRSRSGISSRLASRRRCAVPSGSTRRGETTIFAVNCKMFGTQRESKLKEFTCKESNFTLKAITDYYKLHTFHTA